MWLRSIGCFTLALGIGVGIPVNASAGCQIFVGFDNLYREVWGPVNAECRTWLGHTAPFGNWGVESPVSSRTNGDQFPGWKLLGGHYEWNSCTGEYPPPSEDNYNYPDGVWTSQYTAVGEMTFGYGSDEIISGGNCLQLSGVVHTVVQYTMDLYELDPWCCGDKQVGSLTYPEQSFTWLCAGSGTSAVCNGDAWPWVQPIGGSTAFTALADAWGHAQYHLH